MMKQKDGIRFEKQYKRVSVAMAVCQGETFLQAQIESILEQLDHDDELIISYDMSTDNTEKIILGFQQQDSRVKVIYDEGKGIVDNFNTALKHCIGDYLFISDQDDIWLPDKVKTILSVFERDHSDLVIHNGVHIDENDAMISEDFFSLYHIGPSKIKNLLKPRYSGCCMAFTRNAASYLLPLPCEVTAYDHWLGYCAAQMGRVTFLDKVLLYHRLHGENVTPQTRRALGIILKSRWRLIKAIRRRKKEMKKNV